MLEHLREHPLEFQGLLVSISLVVCTDCKEHHPKGLVKGPGGDAQTRFKSVKHGLLWMLELAYRMAADDKPDAWDLAATVADWVVAARSVH